MLVDKFENIKFENINKENLDKIMLSIDRYSEMSHAQRYFINGFIHHLKPLKVLEVGVSSGGGAALILNALHDIEGAHLFSVDYLEKAYKFPDKLSGFLIEEKFPSLMEKWTIYRGRDVSYFIETIGGDIDLVVLDTAHIHPWETLNFLCILPFVKMGAWVIVHDITLYKEAPFNVAPRYLYSCVATDIRTTPLSDISDKYPFSNIGAFHITQDTKKYIANLFECLLLPWGMLLKDRDLEDINSIILKYYPQKYDFFQKIVVFQTNIHNNYNNLHFWAYVSRFLKFKLLKLKSVYTIGHFIKKLKQN